MSHAEGHREASLERARVLSREPYHGYEFVRGRLIEANLLTQAIKEVQQRYEPILTALQEPEHARLVLTESQWELLAILWLFDEETTQHSVDTYQMVRTKLTQCLLGQCALADAFPSSGVTLEQFLRACLFHDVGKLATPREVLTNPLTDHEVAELLLAHPAAAARSLTTHDVDLSSDMLAHATPSELVTYLHETQAPRPQALLPIRLLLPEEHVAPVDEELARRGMSVDNTLIEVMRIHAQYSEDILTGFGLTVEAQLAGAHHYRGAGTGCTVPLESYATEVDMADIIHLADVEQAMSSARYYKQPASLPVVLDTLVMHVRRGLVRAELAYLWVADEFARMSAVVGFGVDSPHLARVAAFVTEMQDQVTLSQ